MKSDLWKHQKYFCVQKDNCKKSSIERVIESESLKGDYCGMDEELKNVVSHMAKDTITLAAKNDPLIVELGISWVHKTYRMKQRPARRHLISQKMRECGRLLQCLRASGQGTGISMSDFIKPGSFDVVIAAVAETAQWQSASASYATPSMALKLGHNLRKLAAIKTTRAIKSDDEVSRVEAQLFVELMDKEYQEKVSSAALTNLSERKFNTVKTLPTSDDLKKLSDYLTAGIQAALSSTGTMTPQEFKSLQLVMTRLLTFNRRRPMEVESIRCQILVIAVFLNVFHNVMHE